MSLLSIVSNLRGRKRRRILPGPYRPHDGLLWESGLILERGDNEDDQFASNLCLFEDELRFAGAHRNHSCIRLGGGGRYSHWEHRVFLSTSDGTDPNTNGRTYTFDFSLDANECEADRTARSARRWNLHPDGDVFLARGGDRTPPPLVANLGLTNKCNLRCEICGSQKHLDHTGIRRRHMEFATFEAVAETLFPVLSQVELNSQGDPLLHPRIADVLSAIARHRCEVKIQHNGTLLTDPIIDLLLQQHGTLMLSLDAVGGKFDDVRRGGVWSKAEPGLKRLLRERDPRRLAIGVYPTWTARTIGEAINVADWCAEWNVDVVGFHRYVPVQGSWEQAPTEDDYRHACDRLRSWCIERKDHVRVLFEGEGLNSVVPRDRRSEYADAAKAAALLDASHVMFPVERKTSGADYFMTCAAPNEYVEIGLDGQVSACCRSQDVSLGYATSVEQFADVWLGANYDRIRRSLRRGETGAYPLPNCLECVKFFAPRQAGNRRSVDYATPSADTPIRLRVADAESVPIEVIQKEHGFCHIATFPLGLGACAFEIWEDDRPLGPAGCLHDDIRKYGSGRYHVGTTAVYFSTSDGSDARRNGRAYSLRRTA